MKIKRVASLLLAFAILLGGLPFIELTALKVQAAPAQDYVIDSANKVFTVNTEAGWNYFAGISIKGITGTIAANFTGWTVKLAENIEITTAVIPSADDFAGVFDGQNHTITLPKGDSYFAETDTKSLGADVGLFRNIIGNGELKNLIVRINKGSTVYVSKSLMNCNVGSDVISFGAVIGRLSNNAKIKDCALVGEGSVLYRNNKGMQTGGNDIKVRVGAMVGALDDQASAEGCYSDVNVKAWVFSSDNKDNPMIMLNVGGLFGGIESSISSKNCIGINQQIEASNFNYNNSLYTAVGGIAGYCSAIENAYVKGSAINVRQTNGAHLHGNHTDEQPSGSGKGIGAAIAYSYNNTIINCAANTTFSAASNGAIFHDNGYVSNIDAITAERMGTEWVNTNKKNPNLKWLVNVGPSAATIDTLSAKGSLTIQDSYAELNTVAGYQADSDAIWGFVMRMPIKGRVAPISEKVKMAVERNATDTNKIVKKTITLPSVNGIKLYYKLSDATDNVLYTSTKQLEDKGFYKLYSTPVILTDDADLKMSKLLVVAVPEDGNTKLLSTTSEYNLQTAINATDTEIDLSVQNTPAAGYEPKTITTGTLYYTQDATSTGALPDNKNMLTLDIILGTINSAYKINTMDYIAAGSIVVNVFAAKDRFGGDGASSCFVSTATKSSVKGDVVPRPTISPRGTGIISNGVTIIVPTDAQVYYTWTIDPVAGTLPVHPELDASGKPKDPAITKEYTANTVLPFPIGATKLAVRAIAYQKGKITSDEDYVEYSNDANLPLPYAPRLLVAGADHSDAATYPDSSEIKFTHANLAEGLVYFTVNSSTPSASNANAYRYGKGQTYDETKPFSLPTISGRDFIEVKAVFHSNKTLLDSPVGTYRVHTKQALKAPAANIPTGKSVPPGEKLLLSLSDGAITQLNSTGKISAARIKYSDGTDGSTATDDASFTIVGTDKPVNGTEYISYNVNESNEAYSLPIIRYKLGAGATDIDKSGTLCQYGQRRVLSKTVSGITKVTVTYINPLPIVLTGEADKVITVNTVALSELEAYSNSAVASFEYTIFKAAAKPTAIPATSDTAFTMLAPGSFINLATSTANTSIYYTTNNSVPSPQDYLDWVKNGSDAAKKPATMLYDDVAGIVMPNKANTLFTIRAVAHSNDNSLVNSEMVQFTYQMPSPVNTVYVSPSQGSVLQGTAVQLKCGTADAHIFYKLHTTAPDLTDPAVVPKPFVDQLFDATVPIVINKEVWITAIAEKNGVTSTMTSYHYTLYSKTAQPTAIPATTPEAIAMIKPNDVINLSTSTANASIYYTIDNSHPSPQEYLAWVQAGSDASKKPSTMLYKTLEGITMPNITTFFTIRAVAQSTEQGSEDSSEAQFTYQMPAPVNTVYVSPSQGSVLQGTAVQLKCGTADAHIFYKLHTTAPDLTDPAVEPKPFVDQLFDATVPIVINKEVWITAIAEKNGVTSTMTSYHYTLYSKTAQPTAIPATTPEAIATIKPNDVINLSTSTANASIYYTIDNSHPSPQEYLAWVQAGSDVSKKPSTMLYKTLEGITMPNITTFFTIRAVAQSTENGSEDSSEAQFTYQPPTAVQAVFVSPTAGAVVANQSVTLKCSTPGAKIFYRILTQKPANITDPENIPKPYKDQIFDATVPIVITKNIWIVALAEKDGMVSAPMLYEYTVSPLTTEPTASLKTGSVVNRGTRIRLSGLGNIAFTLDGSDPKVAVAAMQSASGGAKAAEAPPKAAEVFFGDSFIVDADFGKSLTVRAFSYGDGKTPSNVVSFTYTVCEKDGYITALPQSGSVITSGDQITLSTTISDGKLFYSTGTDTPSILNRYADAAIDKAENEPYTHYQWIAGENTLQGTSVKIKGTSGSTVTVKALAAANGSEGGATQVFTYTIREKTASPTASIPTGAVTLEGATVTLSAREGDIFFTTDGTTPSTSSRLYTEPIEVPGSMVLKAIALAKDKTESDVVEYHYSYADQAFAPSMSIPSGEIEQGKLLTLSSETKDASIYYTTNGAEPTEKSTLYTAPISIMRPVTIKAIAVYKGLRNSAVNSAFYTVIEPPAPEIGDGGKDKPQGPLNSLVSRRTYFDETAGPKFSAFVARDTATNTVLSAKDDVVPKDAKLIVKRVDTSDSDREAVRTALGNEIVVLYDVSLEKDGEKVDPTGEVELGITIPEEYQNSLVTVCRIGADNTVEEYEPRRSGQDAYFIVNGKLDRYAVTIPEELAVSGGKITINTIGKIAVLVLICLLLAGALAVFIIRKRSKKIESNLPVENDENFEEFFAQELHEDTRDTQQDILPQDEHNDTNG